MKILVTGATGFIGSHLVERLVREGHKVRVLVRKKEIKKAPENWKDNLNLLKKLKVEICYGDLLNKESLDRAIKNMEIVFHLAAIARPMAIPDKLYFQVNETGTKNLLETCKDKKIKKIIIMSSISAIGPSRDNNPINEKTKPKPVDVYGWSKLAQEKVIEKYLKDFKMPVIILRPPMVFGPRDFEMLRLFKAINKRFFPLSSKVKGIEFLYVENLVEACILVMKKGKTGEKYHVSNGEHYSIDDITDTIAKALNKKIIPIKFPKLTFIAGGYLIEFISRILKIHPPFKHDTVEWMTEKYWYSDVTKIKKLGYAPKISLKEGVKKTAEYYKEKNYII